MNFDVRPIYDPYKDSNRAFALNLSQQKSQLASANRQL